MKVGFICPDGERVTFSQCFAACRMEKRCVASVAYLRVMAYSPPDSGKYSVTQLLQPTRIAYLRLTKDYYVSPPAQTYALLGTRVHAGIAKLGEHDNALMETQLEDELGTGRSDIYEQQGDRYYLFDTKVWGSYRVARALGLTPVRVPDPSGAKYKTSGRWGKAGEAKMVTRWEPHPEAADTEELELQLNRYRIFYELLGFRVDEMVAILIVRDGGTASAYEHGITEPLYNLPIRRLPDDEVMDYFKKKSNALYTAVHVTHELPPVCTPKERWQREDGRNLRCEKYCDVREHCPDAGN